MYLVHSSNNGPPAVYETARWHGVAGRRAAHLPNVKLGRDHAVAKRRPLSPR
jgi:hypothetical protein